MLTIMLLRQLKIITVNMTCKARLLEDAHPQATEPTEDYKSALNILILYDGLNF